MLKSICNPKSECRRMPVKLIKIGFYLLTICLLVTVFIFKKNIYRNIDGSQIIQRPDCESDDKVSISIEDMMTSPQVLEQDNYKLIKKVQKDYLKVPSSLGYKLKQNNDDPSMGQSDEIRKILGDLKEGFFVECGALDGETRSNTLVFEKTLGWDGVLIEGDPKNFKLVVEKQRRAWTVPACLSITPYPVVVMFKQLFNVGKISSLNIQSSKSGYAKVQCLPLYTILLSLNRTKVDYFSLDVEGNELEVLKTIPWNKVNITTLSVEFIHGKEGKDVLKKYMMDKGYLVFSEVRHKHGLANDFIFYHPKLIPVK